MVTRSNDGSQQFGQPGFGAHGPHGNGLSEFSLPGLPTNMVMPKIPNNPFAPQLLEQTERVLAAKARYNIGAIVSGGQTGVDTAAFQIADMLKIPRMGFAPEGFINENGDIPEHFAQTMLTPSDRAIKNIPLEFQLPQTVLEGELGRPRYARAVLYEQRTKLNSAFSCATLILSPTPELPPALKIAYDAALTNGHSKDDVFVLPLTNNYDRSVLGDAAFWLTQKQPTLLHIVGPRESECPHEDDSIGRMAFRILEDLLARDDDKGSLHNELPN